MRDVSYGRQNWANKAANSDARTWVETRRAEAVSDVKDAVRRHKTEGGVNSRDPGKPFEAAFSVLRGKLLTTNFTD